jgi:demethylmacrocin O-methyltransferase
MILLTIKDYIKNKISPESRRIVRNRLDDLRSLGKGNNLNQLGLIYRTDKALGHHYMPHYQFHFSHLKYEKINLLEIGAGGYEKPRVGGRSLRMWKKYFPCGSIYAIDIHDKSALEENRIRIFRGSQTDSGFLEDVFREMGRIDIIIDDGSHRNEHVIESFKLLFPKLNDGGIYVVEDTQTSYWKDFGGDSDDLNNPATTMNFFKSLTDSLNHQEFIRPGYKPGYFEQKIISMHFYHNLIFIYKGNNDEMSNIVVNNKRNK